jgi:RND family efflux transporter MFP subunit
MKNKITQPEADAFNSQPSNKPSAKFWAGAAAVTAIVAGAIVFGPRFASRSAVQAAGPPAAVVTVSMPLKKDLSARLQFLGQYSAVERVELRAQVGGTLTHIGFKDGDIVHQGDFLFEIDPTPYQIKLSQATAQLEKARTQVEKARTQVEKARAQVERGRVRVELASLELTRAQTLQKTDAGTTENVEQRSAEQQSAQAAFDEAQAAVREAEAAVREAEATGREAESLVRDARFDLNHCRILAPFTGRIGTHLVSVGNLVAGSRAGANTTLLATLITLNPIYLNFDMSEADYMTFVRARQRQKALLANKVDASLSDETNFSRQGTLNFVDNALDRSSGTIHARATMRNEDLMLTPGAFARVRLALSTDTQVLLLPDASVLADQSEHMVLTVGSDNVVTPKKVDVGDLRYGLRVIRSGLAASDRVIIDGIPVAAPGSKVSPRDGSIQLGSDEGKN